MHGRLESNRALLEGLRLAIGQEDACEVVVCVPFPYLAQAQSVLTGSVLAWGAQDVSAHNEGAYTGEVAAAMLADFACRFVIVGHSERRALHGETDAVVAEKFCAAQAAGLTPILCVGETLAERESGRTMEVVHRQLAAVLELAGVAVLARAVVAYEPVWAIGTGRTATPEQAQEAHAAIRAQVAAGNAEIAADLRIVYGGSVKPQNAAALFAQADVDGGLIGGASLVLEDFLTICQAAV
ncbi:MAG: Triosephosphate isomerase [Betaproteobacteria bacterium ADurb.Bin341]|nr:MAG: Triosephosphate isomerase [Betaproteobacteria bacterium ADurb.Bin341]